jgi:hypothetical protein
VNHEEAGVFFDSLGEATDSRAPLVDLLAAGRVSERRKRRRTIAASAAAVALVLGGGAVVAQTTARVDDPPAPSRLVDPPAAPDGMRLVGKGSVVIAVPESWSTGATRCGEPVEPTVWFPEEVDIDCPSPPREPVPQLRIGELSSPLGSRLFESSTPTTSRLPDGTEIVETPVLCMDSFPESCTLIVTVPSEDTYFILNIPDRKQGDFAQSVRDSLQELPEGFTTVPAVPAGTMRKEAETLIEEAGLEATTRLPDVNIEVAASDPAAGSVARVGSVVTLLPRSEAGLTDEQTAAVVTIVDRYIVDNPSWEVRVATAYSEPGTVAQPNTGKECQSGELLQISLFGSFDIAVSGFAPNLGSPQAPDPDPLAGVPTEVLLTADAMTEEVCLLGVGTGTREPDPAATVVYPVEGAGS